MTPFGGIGLNALHDFGKSGGTVVQARYLAELPFGRVTVYPELGIEFQDKAYTSYYYGTSGADAEATGKSYHPSSARNQFAGIMIETKLTEHVYANAYFRQTIFDDTISRSPLVINQCRSSLLLALAYRF